MVANRVDPGKGEADKSAKPAGAEAKPAATAQSGGGIKAWLPLIITIVAMPALAYAITTYVLLPQLQKGLGIAPAAQVSGKHESGSEKKKGGKEGGESAKQEMFVMNKVLVNVANTMGSRYLLSSFTLAGSDPELRSKVEKREAQLRDLAMGILSTKTINDIEKPTIRNLIRSELMSAFNNVLGPDTIQEIYITEFAIQ